MEKQRPILFSPPMVNGILDDRKLMTRRTRGLEILNKSPNDYVWLHEYNQMDIPKKAIPYDDNFYYAFTGKHNNSFLQVLTCPYGKVGDLLYVKEAYFAFGIWIETKKRGKSGKLKWEFIDHTFETGQKYAYLDKPPKEFQTGISQKLTWHKRNSLFMPKDAARIWLQITDIKAEQVQDISEEDAIAEGVESTELLINGNSQGFRYKDYLMLYTDPCEWYGKAYYSFQSLWRKINGEESWNKNVWVWAIRYKVLSKTGLPNL